MLNCRKKTTGMKTINMLKNKTFLLAASLFLVATICNAINPTVAFKPGERISYDLYYNWGIIWIHAGSANFAVYETTYHKEPSYQFSVSGNSAKSFDKFFLVRDSFVTIVNQKNFLPMYYRRIVREDSYWAKDEYFFTSIDSNKTSVITDCKRRKGKRNVDTLCINPSVTDLVTAIYKARNTDMSKVKKNDKIPFSIIFDDDDKPYNLWLSFLGREQVKLRDGEKFNCLKFKPLLIKGDVFKQEDAMTIWISDDANKIPIMVETKIRVGSLKVILNNVSNPKYAVSSLIK